MKYFIMLTPGTHHGIDAHQNLITPTCGRRRAARARYFKSQPEGNELPMQLTGP